MSDPTTAPYGDGNRTEEMAFVDARNNVVHEFGHITLLKHSRKKLKVSLISDKGWPESPVSAQTTWRQHSCKMDEPGDCQENEVFSDMFLGWVFDTYSTDKESPGPDRKTFMDDYAKGWLNP